MDDKNIILLSNKINELSHNYRVFKRKFSRS